MAGIDAGTNPAADAKAANAQTGNAQTGTAKTALVIGAAGGIGGEMARTLLRRGWRVTALHRAPETIATPSRGLVGINWMKGDAMVAVDVQRAAAGASLIVHGANPPGYKDWDRLTRPMLGNSIAAARATGARLLFPGTVYNFAPETFPRVDEQTPQQPATRKGRIRVEMEEMLRAASRQGVRCLIVRAGDFFGPHAGNNWFSQCLVKPGRPVRGITYPGARDVGHAWAYLPDLAETMMRLVERDAALATFEVFHFAGHWLANGGAMIEAIRDAIGNHDIRSRRLFWPAMYVAYPFVALCREMLEMRYLWQRELRLDNSKLIAFLGEEPHTDLHAAVRASLIGLGCMPRRTVTDAPSS